MSPHLNFRPEILRLVPSKQRLTSAAGLGTLLEAFDESPLRAPFTAALPKRISPRSSGAYRLGLIQLASFLQGHDCLADLERFRDDPMLSEVMKGETVAPRTMGDFLRDFESQHLESMNRFLATPAKAYRVQLEKMLKKQFKPSLAPRLAIRSAGRLPRISSKMKSISRPMPRTATKR